MASQSLYRKWRSQTFDEMVGQEEIRRTLKNALMNNTLRHAYLFTGPRGTGKTSTARLLAKTVNCLNPHDGEPCNECEQCREITAGTSFNVIEIDAASNRGIDNIRELREKIMVPPTTGKYKIYILDEAHMLTSEAFNALLKTLEEPPDYAIFVLATTEMHKMLATVISRCECHAFKRFSTRQIVGHISFIAEKEGITLEKSAAELIARTAAGGMRDALSLLDQAIAYAGDVVTLAQVQAMLGVADPRAISKLITHIAALESPALLYLIHELSEAGADLRQINAQMIEYWRALMLAKAGADVATILDLTEDEVQEVTQLTPSFTLEELTECARIFAQNDLMQKNQGTPQLGLELATLECIELHRRAQIGQPVRYQNNGQATQPIASAPPSASQPAPRQVTPPPTAQPMQPPSTPQRPAPARREETSFESHRGGQRETSEQAASAQPPASGQGQGAIAMQQVIASWENVKKRTRQKSAALATYLGMCDVVGVESDGENSIVVVRALKPRHHSFIREENRPKDIEWALSTEFGMPCKVRILGPEQPYQNPGSSASYSLGVVAPQPSAYRERPQPAAPPASLPETPRPSTSQERPANQRAKLSERPEVYTPAPLARPREVSENKKVPLSKAEAQQKAQQDPVVLEAIRIFGAKLGDIQPK